MSHDITKEVNLQNASSHRWWKKAGLSAKVTPTTRACTIRTRHLKLRTNHPTAGWEKFSRVYPNDTERHFLDARSRSLKKPTATQPISSRAPGYARRTSSRPENPQCPFFAVSFKPEHNLNPETLARYQQNISVLCRNWSTARMPQIASLQKGRESQKMAHRPGAVYQRPANATLELKSEFKQAVQNAIAQSKRPACRKIPPPINRNRC